MMHGQKTSNYVMSLLISRVKHSETSDEGRQLLNCSDNLISKKEGPFLLFFHFNLICPLSCLPAQTSNSFCFL